MSAENQIEKQPDWIDKTIGIGAATGIFMAGLTLAKDYPVISWHLAALALGISMLSSLAVIEIPEITRNLRDRQSS